MRQVIQQNEFKKEKEIYKNFVAEELARLL
jgi:hypothetical protein